MNENANAWTAMPQGTPSPYDTDGALDWDSEISSEGSEFTLLPEGDYPFTVTKFERQRFEGSAKLPPCNKAELTLSIDGGAQGSATIRHNLFMHRKCEWALSDFFLSIGQKKPGETLHPRWNEVVGARGMCRVKVSTYHSNKYGDEREKNEITKFLLPGPGAAPGGSPTPTPAQTPVQAAPYTPPPPAQAAPYVSPASAQAASAPEPSQQSWNLPKPSPWGAWGK